MKLLDLFLKNKTQEVKDYETLLALSGNPDTPLELINSLRIQQGLSVLVDRDRFPKGTRILSKHETNKLFSKEPYLLEIKLKDTDSVPEVYYKGERLDELPQGLVDVSYHWKTDGFANDDRGANDITIQYFSSFNDKYPDMKTIGHKRDM
ncbi:hypothetical protein [Enterococcus faecium]|uniref:hypothetical protein n=1 Tax=Enterococcus faecium TaxID=1352 RepID=UPI0001B6E2DE|nr:hypothetical protein [Enterococcus faecium]EEV47230.1 predicted protein [Enterococcus faecium 1,231,501]MDT6386896.1 hypothetical protein [Enterococcus faecium]PHL12217.1 hypothetical protein CQR40_11835 [Enterococcus faecium]